MKKPGLLTAVTAAVALSLTLQVAHADQDATSNPSDDSVNYTNGTDTDAGKSSCSGKSGCSGASSDKSSCSGASPNKSSCSGATPSVPPSDSTEPTSLNDGFNLFEELSNLFS